MRRLQKGKRGKPRKKTGPLAEGIIVPLNKKGQRDWASMSDEKLVGYAKVFIVKKRIKNKKGLAKEDVGLYDVLLRRKLLDRLRFERGRRKQRDWASMSDDELVEYVRRFIEKSGIKNKHELEKVDNGLYGTLRKRKLLRRLKFKEGQRSWASMSDDELVEYTRKLIEEKRIKNRKGLQKEDIGLYSAVLPRKLLDRLEFEKVQRDWAPMSDKKLIEYAKNFIKEKEITSRNELQKEDSGLYTALRKRKLLNHVFVPLEKAKERQAILDVVDAMEEFDSS